MGLFSWFRNWRNNSRKEKELAAIDYLKKSLFSEEERLSRVNTLVSTIEEHLKAHRFTEAEKWIPELAKEMAYKKLMDKMEDKDWQMFKKTIFKDLREQMQGMR